MLHLYHHVIYTAILLCILYFQINIIDNYAIFCAVIWRGSVSFLRFHFRSHVQFSSYTISLVCRLKYPYSYFSTHFSFLVIIIVLAIMLNELFLITVISLSLLFII